MYSALCVLGESWERWCDRTRNTVYKPESSLPQVSKFVFLILSSSCVTMSTSQIVTLCTDYLEVMVCEKCGGGRTIRDSQLCFFFPPAVGHSSQAICADGKQRAPMCRPCWRQLGLKNQCSKNQCPHLPPPSASLGAFYLIWIWTRKYFCGIHTCFPSVPPNVTLQELCVFPPWISRKIAACICICKKKQSEKTV